MASTDAEKSLAEILEDLHRRCVAILREEIDHAAEEASKGEFDPVPVAASLPEGTREAAADDCGGEAAGRISHA